MQLGLPTDVLLLTGAGALALLVAFAVVLLRGRERRTAPGTGPHHEPTTADWTGEAANGDAAAAAAPAAPDRPLTVAEVVAARESGLTELPARYQALLGRRADAPLAPVALAPAVPAPAEPQPEPPAPVLAGAAPASGAGAFETGASGGTAPAAEPVWTAPRASADLGPVPAPWTLGDRAVAAVRSLDRVDPATRPEPTAGPRHCAEPAEPDPSAAEPPVAEDPAAEEPAPTGRSGSDRQVGAAVAQVLATRAAAPDRSAGEGRRGRHGGSGVDARDRLLAVLLDDPARAVAAATDLDECRGQLERLTDAVRHERAVLAEVLRRLADSGLRPAQMAQLSGLPVDDVDTLLAPPAPDRG